MRRKVSLAIVLWLFILSSLFLCYPQRILGEDMNNKVSVLTAQQKKQLLDIAQETIDEFVKTGQRKSVSSQDLRLQEQEGAFVTIHKFGQLRGCIGNILGQGPLYLLVRDMAIVAASEDSRFAPVRKDELKDLELEISVLSKPWPIASVDEIQMGIHGVILGQGFRQGIFLPQVAIETGWSKEEFLSELCSQKAGLSKDCYMDPKTTIRIFTADVFSQKDFK